MPQAATKLLEFKVGGTKKNKKHAIPPTHVHIVKCKGWLKMLDFFRPSTLTTGSFAAPWAIGVQNIAFESSYKFWMVRYLFKSIAAFLRSDISIQSTLIYKLHN